MLKFVTKSAFLLLLLLLTGCGSESVETPVDRQIVTREGLINRSLLGEGETGEQMRLVFEEPNQSFKVVDFRQDTRVDLDKVDQLLESSTASSLDIESCYLYPKIERDLKRESKLLDSASVLTGKTLSVRAGRDILIDNQTLLEFMMGNKGPAEDKIKQICSRTNNTYSVKCVDGEVRELSGTYGERVGKEELIKRLGAILKEWSLVPGENKAEVINYSGVSNRFEEKTYVEVSIEKQTLYLYVGGNLQLETQIVTGNPNTGNETPIGIYYVDTRETNRVLKGTDYEVPVKYWAHFYNGCGFHDANWKTDFGCDEYLRAGSHGCVNMRESDIKKMYSLISVGTPVIIY